MASGGLSWSTVKRCFDVLALTVALLPTRPRWRGARCRLERIGEDYRVTIEAPDITLVATGSAALLASVLTVVGDWPAAK